MKNDDIDDLIYQQVDELDPTDYSFRNPGSPVDRAVKDPNHYQFIGMSVKDLIEKGLTHDELIGWFKGNVIKYRMRAFKKGKLGMQDIAKAQQYEDMYGEYLECNTPSGRV